MSIVKSDSISKLVSALALAKAAFKPVLKLSENPGFKRNGKASKYADLATAIEATEESLLANGLVVSQFPINDGERVGALTLLTHTSGEYLGEAFTLPLGQQNAQTGVAAVTYARRTGYLAALGIASEDDDGQTASGLDDNTIPLRDYTDYQRPPDMPDFRDAQRGPATPPTQRTTTPKAEPPTIAECLPPPPPDVPVEQQNQGPAVAPEHGDAYEGPDSDALPTEEQLVTYRAKFKTLGDDLAAKGKLTASRSLPVNRKVHVFLLSITKAPDAKQISKNQWDNFFERVDAATANPEVGLVGLATLVNKANGIEPKQ